MNVQKTIIIYLFTLLFIACGNRISDDNNVCDTVLLMDDENEKENSDNNSEEYGIENTNIIFSTSDLFSSDWLTSDEIEQKTSYIGHSDNSYIILPLFKNREIVIVLLDDGDFEMYYLCLIVDGFVKVDNNLISLDITPDWSEPENEVNVYCKKTFKIYEDYTIEINTEEKNGDSKVKKYTKNYRINDEGNFYEIERNE